MLYCLTFFTCTLMFCARERKNFMKYAFVFPGQGSQYVGMGTHTVVIEALDDHIIVDQWLLDYNTKRQSYRFPL